MANTRRTITLTVITGPDKGKRHVISSLSARLGRDAVCEVPIGDTLISRIHGTLEVTERCHAFVFTDHSRNGTYYVKAGATTPHCTVLNTSTLMQPGDMLMLGHTTLRLEPGDTYPVPSAEDAAARSSAPAPGGAPPVVAPFGLGTQPEGDGPATAHVTRIASAQAMCIYTHPFTQLALARGRERRAKEAAATAAAAGTVPPPMLPTRRADTVAMVGDAVDPRSAPPAKTAAMPNERWDAAGASTGLEVRQNGGSMLYAKSANTIPEDADGDSFVEESDEDVALEDVEDEGGRSASDSKEEPRRPSASATARPASLPPIGDSLAQGKRMLRGAFG